MLGRRRAESKSKEGGGQLERELARTVREVVLGLVRTPIVLRDPGVGRTLDEYYVARGVRIRIAEVPRQDGSMEYCSFADEPGLTVLDEVLYAKTLRSIFELMDPEKVLRGFDPGTFFREALRSTAKKIGAQLDEERELGSSTT